jgi:hypothetical protein
MHACRAEYVRAGGRAVGDRIIRCHLPVGHQGEHEEADTEITWQEPDTELPWATDQPSTYRKKPIEIQAMHFTPENGAAVWEWAESKPLYDGFGKVIGLRIYTLEGMMQADFGDWIIRGVKGEFYPCKPDIFEATYELVAVSAPTEGTR